MRGLAGEGLGLRVGHVAGLADGGGDALLRWLAELLELAIEEVGDGCGRGACELRDVHDGHPACHAGPSHAQNLVRGKVQVVLDFAAVCQIKSIGEWLIA